MRSIISPVCSAGVLLCEEQKVFGTEVNMRVKPGESVTLYCDCALPFGSHNVWMRNCSHENQPSLLIDPPKLFLETFPRFSFLLNSSSNSYDLHIENVSVSDEGLYYCAERKKTFIDVDGVNTKYVYEYGNKTTRLAVLDSAHESTIASTSPPVSECVFCWTLLLSVCPVCVLLSSLLSSICVYCFCRPQTTGSDMSAEILKANVFMADCLEKHQCEASKTGKICVHTEVSYRRLTSKHPYTNI
ncbi:uncharacterized protein LOC130215466 isoform X3 [Danio aesculapii]|uniref:uncharacterized protein LOC130215466 isoform X3 n=1 Tax=Danio aesculapii TaxID=1142201 RepID=UPI0024BF1376|nr:uncharacterized protein LOC130215466 isoform X3 [Danio aesculapii]